MAENRTQRFRFGVMATTALAMFAVALTAGGAVAAPTARTANAGAAAQQDLAHPTKALCKKPSYKIGYDVFSDTQPFAVSLTNGLIDAAKSIGCAQVVKAVDNLNGPVAVGNVKTLLNEGIDGFVDFQVLAAYQPAIAKLLKSGKVPAVTVVGATLPGFPQVGLAPFQTEKNAAIYMAKQAKKQFPGQIPYFLGGAEPTSGAAVLARYKGAVAGIKEVYPNIPSDHIIQVNTEGVATTAYTTTLSALSKVPSNARRPDAGRERRGPRRHVQGRAGPARRQLPGELVRRRFLRPEAGLRRPEALRRSVVSRPGGLGAGSPLAGHESDERRQGPESHEYLGIRGHAHDPVPPL